MDRYMRYILVPVFVAMWLAFRAPAWLAGTDVPYMLRALAYPFFHASVWHLAVNALATWTVFSPGRRRTLKDLVISYLVSVLVYGLSLRPVIGFSNVLYAALGLGTPSLSSQWWKRPEVLAFLAVTVLMLFVPQFSALSHIFAFLAGMLVAAVRRFISKTLKDAGHFVQY
jgi:membrane associated rhomboid family serine protease